MAANSEADMTRRWMLFSSLGFLVPRWMWAQSLERPVLCWKLQENGDFASETVSGAQDSIASRTGHAIWVGEGRDRALRLDGYSVWIEHPADPFSLRGGGLTVAAWLALESYPVNRADIIHMAYRQMGSKPESAFHFSIDKWGCLQFEFGASPHAKGPPEERKICKSSTPVPKAKWVHLAASFGAAGVTIYQDGVPCGRGPAADFKALPMNQMNITLGKDPDGPSVAGTFTTGVLNGLVRDVVIFDHQLSPSAIAEVGAESRPGSAPDLQINRDWCAGDPQRPLYHALPPRAWTNEPHGLVHWRGQFHLFYQKNPNGPYWGHIHWGHMTSPDLYRWTEMPIALAPEPGPDSEGCWSGSVIEYEDQLALIYTAGDGKRATICLALSSDGVNFTKFAGNPIIAAPPQGNFPEFRDPFVWRETDTYYLIIGSAVRNVGGTALLYRSRDLVTWEFRKPLLVGDRETSGVFWEMPIFVKVGNDHVLIVCEVPGRASYWVGSWKDETFTPYFSAPRRLELFNHLLSPTPLIDIDKGERVITMGIVPDERRPRECWSAGWAHLYSLPRVLATDSAGHLWQRPLENIYEFCEPAVSIPSIALQENVVHALDDVAGLCLYLRLTFSRGESHSVSLLLRRAPDGSEQTEIRYEWEIGRLTLDRSRSSLDPEVKRDLQQVTYFPPTENEIHLQVFIDHSVLEVFLDDRSAFATRIYPTLNSSDHAALACVGTGATAENIRGAKINRPSR